MTLTLSEWAKHLRCLPEVADFRQKQADLYRALRKSSPTLARSIKQNWPHAVMDAAADLVLAQRDRRSSQKS